MPQTCYNGDTRSKKRKFQVLDKLIKSHLSTVRPGDNSIGFLRRAGLEFRILIFSVRISIASRAVL